MMGKKSVELYIAVTLTLLAISISIGTASAAFTGHSGGPDYLGYTYKDNTIAGGPVYNWEEIDTSGTQILPSSDDSVVTNIPLGFFFNYYGTDYSQVNISNNGIIFSGAWTGQWINEPIGASSPHGFLAPYWDDLVTWNNADAIYYQTLGTAPHRRFIVEWHNNGHYSNTNGLISFEAILYEGSNNILFQYQSVDFGVLSYNNGVSATVGIESPSGQGLQYSYNEAVINPGLAILFNFPSFSGTNMVITKNAPVSKDHGTQMTYDLYYNNFGGIGASNVVIVDTLPSNVEYISSNPAGTWDAVARTVTWNLGSVSPWPTGNGVVHLTVNIPSSVPVGSQVINTASISTQTLEERYDDNQVTIHTSVTGSGLPPDVGISTPNSGGNTPSVYFGTPTTFTYQSCDTASGVDIRIHINDGREDIIGSMAGGPPSWSYTTTFYPRHGAATVTYTVNGCGNPTIGFNIYIDPAGYVYDIVTNARIQGAVVTLQRPDGSGGWENVPTGVSPAIMQPDTNPLITDINGMYQWNTLAGTYRVHVEANGYYPADSIWVTVPPPVTDLNVGLRPIGGTQDIPEFPTLALPIASVLGIMFLMSKRR